MDFILGPFGWVTAALSIVGWFRWIKAMRADRSRRGFPPVDESKGDILTGLILIVGSVFIIGWMIGRLFTMVLSPNFALVLVVVTAVAAAQLAVGVLNVAQAMAHAYAKVLIDGLRDDQR